LVVDMLRAKNAHYHRQALLKSLKEQKKQQVRRLAAKSRVD